VLTATQSGVWGIGVDTDFYYSVFDGGSVPGAEYLLSSAMKRLDNAVYATIADVVSGTFTSGEALYDLAADGVGLAPFHETEPFVPAGVRGALDRVSYGISKGLIDVWGTCPVITVGVGAALTGPAEPLGWPEANAVQLAVDEVNASGGIDIGGSNYWLALATADDGCNPTLGITAAQTLLDAGSVAVVGYTCSGASNAAGPLHAAAGVAMVSPSSTGPWVTEQGYTTTFRLITRDDSPPMALAAYLADWLNLDRAAIVELEGFWATYATGAISETFTGLGGTITGRWVLTSTVALTTTLQDVKHSNPDAIFYCDNDGDRAGLLSAVADGLGMTDVTIAWSTFSENDAVLAAYAVRAGAAAAGDYAAMFYLRTADMPGFDAFNAAYQAAGFPNYGGEATMFGAYAYDAAKIIADAIGRAQSTDPAAIRDAIAATAGYQGVVGRYRGFDAKGDVIPQWLWLVRYSAGQWQPFHPAKAYLPLALKGYPTGE
jgi:branched-chain amino acid transport system substrate-binding protein